MKKVWSIYKEEQIIWNLKHKKKIMEMRQEDNLGADYNECVGLGYEDEKIG